MSVYQNKKKVVFLLATLGCAVPGTQAAEMGKFYAGAAVGHLSFPDFADLYDDEEDEGETQKVEDTATAFKLVGGFQLTENFALEAFYGNFGEPNASSVYVDEEYDDVIETDESIGITGFGIAAKAMIPVSQQFDVYLSLGLLRWSGELEIVDTYTFNNEVESGVETDRYTKDLGSTDLTYAFGASYQLTNSITLFAEYSIMDTSYEKQDWDFENKMEGFFLGINYHFGPVSTSQQAPAANTGSGPTSGTGSKSGAKSRPDAGTRKRGDRSLTACDPKYKDIGGVLCD